MKNLNLKLEKVIQTYLPKIENCRIDEAKREYLRKQEKNIILDSVKEKVTDINIGITLIHEWKPESPDMSVCKSCKEVIYSNQYVLGYKLNEEVIEQHKPVRLCETCYLKIDKN